MPGPTWRDPAFHSASGLAGNGLILPGLLEPPHPPRRILRLVHAEPRRIQRPLTGRTLALQRLEELALAGGEWCGQHNTHTRQQIPLRAAAQPRHTLAAQQE